MIDFKVSKDKDSRRVDWENLIYVMKQNQKPCTNTKKVIDRGKRSKTVSEVKPVENISKNL